MVERNGVDWMWIRMETGIFWVSSRLAQRLISRQQRIKAEGGANTKANTKTDTSGRAAGKAHEDRALHLLEYTALVLNH